MGIECGFDIYPPLARSPENQARHELFVQEVLMTYGRRLDDGLDGTDPDPREHINDKAANRSTEPDPSVIRINPTGEIKHVEFCVGEHPSIPRHCENFLRFSSEISGRSRASSHITTVCKIARKHFGDRVYAWNEMNGYSGRSINTSSCYNWAEVHTARKRIENLQSAEGGEVEKKEEGDTQESAKTSSDAADTVTTTTTTTAATTTPPIDAPASNGPMYDITLVPDRGLGVVAKVDIAEGTRILLEAPLFTLPADEEDQGSAEHTVLRAVRALSRDEQRAFFGLRNTNNNSSHSRRRRCSPLLGICMSNMLPLGDNDMGGLFIEASRINHACQPNAQHAWNASLAKAALHALRDIPAGSEITISYLSGTSMGYAERQRHLRDRFAFTCTCTLCSLTVWGRAHSDMQLSFIRAATDTDEPCTDTDTMQQGPVMSFLKLHELVKRLHAEDIRDTRLSGAYYAAAQVAAIVGDKARSTALGERAYAARKRLSGEDNPVTALFRRLAERPVEHPLYGARMKCYEAIWEPPRSLGPEAFEKWLWSAGGWGGL